MGRGLNREDAVRFSFLLSAPVILAAGLLKAHDLLGPAGRASTARFLSAACCHSLAPTCRSGS